MLGSVVACCGNVDDSIRLQLVISKRTTLLSQGKVLLYLCVQEYFSFFICIVVYWPMFLSIERVLPDSLFFDDKQC